ncbi:MAG: trehalose-phosphatase [Candidatus Omnitrophota bacterium]
MRHLMRHLHEIEKITRDKQLMIFLDFDGTLAPIRRDPEKVFLSAGARDILKKLASRADTAISIITGRKIAEIIKLTGIKNIIYVGNHGLEYMENGKKRVRPEALKAAASVEQIKKKMAKQCAGLKGIMIEDKGCTLSIHYRKAGKEVSARAALIFNDITKDPLKARSIRVTSGKKVWEVRPFSRWNKGTAVTEIIKRHGPAGRKIIPLYIGDDVTDEDAFKAVRKKGFAVKVVKEPATGSAADYYLRGIREVILFLRELYFMKNDRKIQYV